MKFISVLAISVLCTLGAALAQSSTSVLFVGNSFTHGQGPLRGSIAPTRSPSMLKKMEPHEQTPCQPQSAQRIHHSRSNRD